MPMHLSKREVQVLDGMLRAKAEPKDALKKLQLARCKDRTKGPSKSAVYAFWSGKSYVRNKAERRGRKTKSAARYRAHSQRRTVEASQGRQEQLQGDMARRF